MCLCILQQTNALYTSGKRNKRLEDVKDVNELRDLHELWIRFQQYKQIG